MMQQILQDWTVTVEIALRKCSYSESSSCQYTNCFNALNFALHCMQFCKEISVFVLSALGSRLWLMLLHISRLLSEVQDEKRTCTEIMFWLFFSPKRNNSSVLLACLPCLFFFSLFIYLLIYLCCHCVHVLVCFVKDEEFFLGKYWVFFSLLNLCYMLMPWLQWKH